MPASADAPLTVTTLRCDDRAAPLAIATPTPRLSWTVQAAEVAETRGESIVAAQVQVSRRADSLQRDAADVWDSGRVEGAALAMVYAGPALRSNDRVCWRARVFTASGRTSPWSYAAPIGMGLLEPTDWVAKWIADPAAVALETPTSGPLPILRRSLVLAHPARHAVVHVCGLGHFELRVNGQKVGHDELEPAWTNYRKTLLYATHDVTGLLRPGENVLGVLLGNGMFNVAGGRYKKFKGSFGPPMLLLQMHVTLEDGSEHVIASDEAWRVADGPVRFSCIYGGEDHDARLEPRGWDRKGFDDSAWRVAAVVEGMPGARLPQDSPPVRVMGSATGADLPPGASGERVIDLGRNLAGRPTLHVTGPAGATVTLVPGELLTAEGLPNQKHTGSPVSFSYTLAGDAAGERWSPRFTYSGFRYLQVQAPADVRVEAGAQDLHASADVVGSFRCSNDLFNRIHALINAAIVSNLNHVLTDCPHREKLGWLEQTHLMFASMAWNYDLEAFYRKTTRDMRDAQLDDGIVPTIAPQFTTFGDKWAVFNHSPEWGSAMVLAPWQLYQRTADAGILKSNYAAAARFTDHLLATRDERGTVSFGLGDWYDIGEGNPGFAKLTSLGVTGTATLFQDLVAMRQMASALGRSADADRYAALADEVRAAFHRVYFDAGNGCYDRGSQTAQAMPLALGMVDRAHASAVLEHLVADIRGRDDHITAGDVGFYYVVRALQQAGRSDVIADLLSRTDPPSYGAQLAMGATTLTEAWDANPGSSHNHLMLGHAEMWFYESLCGLWIDRTRDAEHRLSIRPQPVKQVDFAEATHHGTLGEVRVRWQREAGGRFRLDVTIPVAAGAATLRLPTREAGTITEGGHPIASVPQVRVLETRDGGTELLVRSGTYRFACATG
jgi:hypothetical protein